MKNPSLFLTSALIAALALSACSSHSLIKSSPEPIGTAFGALKTGAYAEVNSVKNQGEVYYAKNTRTFVDEEGNQRLDLVPKSFNNAYSDVVVVFQVVPGKGISTVRMEFQGENFSDRYITPELKPVEVDLTCDGQTGRLKWNGRAESKSHSECNVVDIQLIFELNPTLKAFCTAK